MADVSIMCSGWEVVCPDGRVQHYPFHNQDDAEGAANWATTRRCQPSPDPDELVTSQPPCPNGAHRVRALADLHEQSTRRGEA